MLKRLNIPLNSWVDISDKIYHSSPGLSASGLRDFTNRCPAYYKYRKENREPDHEKVETLIVGSAIHTFILEPSKFRSTYIVAPTSNKRKKEWREFVFNIDPRDKEKPILRKESVEMMMKIKKSLSTPTDEYGTNVYDHIIHHPKARRELSIYTIDRKRGILIKCKVDINLDGIMFDLKSTKNAKHESFSKDMANLGYGLQGAFYMNVAKIAGVKSKGFGFIAIEKTPPFLHSTIVMEARDIKLSSALLEKSLDEFAFSRNNNLWYGYNGIDKKNKQEKLMVPVAMPNWYRYDIESKFGFTI